MTEKMGRADYLDVISGLLIIHMIVGHTLLTFVFLTLALFTWRDRWIPARWVGEK